MPGAMSPMSRPWSSASQLYAWHVLGRPVTDTPQLVTPEDLEHFAMVSARYGYWNATPEENAADGIQLF